jgi:DNA-directed RNA polymerase specialized sigma24 family protein
MSGDNDTALREFVTSRLPQLRRSAFLMCGDWKMAAELTRATLARLVADSRRGVVADPDVYAYADLMEACRRRNRRREHVFDALHKLTPRCRAVLVLRHWDGFDAEAAGAMLDLNEDQIAAYERAGLAALEKLLGESEAAMAG